VLSPREVRWLQESHDWFPHATAACHVSGDETLDSRLDAICRSAAEAVARGCRIV
jgi:hypothetical protein